MSHAFCPQALNPRVEDSFQPSPLIIPTDAHTRAPTSTQPIAFASPRPENNFPVPVSSTYNLSMNLSTCEAGNSNVTAAEPPLKQDGPREKERDERDLLFVPGIYKDMSN